MPDWEKIKTEYIMTAITYEALSKKHGVGLSALVKHAQKEKWRAERLRHRKKIVKSVSEKVSKKQASEYANQILRLQAATERTTQAAERMAQFEDMFKQYATVPDGEGGGVREFAGYSAKDLKDFASALKELTQVVRNLYDVPTIQEEKAFKLAEKRLELEREKAAVDNTVEAVEIRYDADLEELGE